MTATNVHIDEHYNVHRSINPDAHAAGAVNGVAIDMKGMMEACAILQVGALGTSATLDMKIQESVDGSAGWTDVTGALITQVTEASPDGSSSLSIIRLRAQALTKRFIRTVMTVAVATSDCGVLVIVTPGSGQKPVVLQSDINEVVVKK